jgi:hypothetical protein
MKSQYAMRVGLAFGAAAFLVLTPATAQTNCFDDVSGYCERSDQYLQLQFHNACSAPRTVTVCVISSLGNRNVYVDWNVQPGRYSNPITVGRCDLDYSYSWRDDGQTPQACR